MAESKAAEALTIARKLYDRQISGLEFHNALFGNGGELGRLFPSAGERAEFLMTKEYRDIDEMRTKLGGLLGDRSGKILLRLPKALHEALVQEAEAEGVSLNQLCLTKLAFSLGQALR